MLDQINLKKSVLKTWVMDIEFAHLETLHIEIADSHFQDPCFEDFEGGDELKNWHKNSEKHYNNNGSKYTQES